jgi:hypothetical protein
MTDSNLSDPPASADRSPFQGSQNALTRRALPGPAWAWPVLGVLAAAGLLYLVTRSPAEHAAPRTAHAEESTPSSALDFSKPTSATVAPVTAPPTPLAALGVPTAEPATPAGAPPKDGAAAGAITATDPSKASDVTEPSKASASPATKKKARAGARRPSHKRSARTP